MRKFKKFNASLKRVAAQIGAGNGTQRSRQNGKHQGQLGDVTIIVVDEEYIDRKGNTQKVQRDYHLILANASVRGVCMYGQIQDLSAQRDGLDEAERYPERLDGIRRSGSSLYEDGISSGDVLD
ncbi:hypothetical protein NM449_17825 (plasmid) [Vibrio metschnikovii]|uniref:hypothetical protein n=1 Tax=Vibrio metschnikovii TaxID=28172 RepID=UPI00315DA0F1